jgi:hypothetical protein
MSTNILQQRARTLRLHGIIAHWNEIADAEWLPPLLQWEETELLRRSLERRLKSAQLGRFKTVDQFDWVWLLSVDGDRTPCFTST